MTEPCRIVLLLCILFTTFVSSTQAQEVELSGEEYARLDAFEQQILRRADAAFAAGTRAKDEAAEHERRRRTQEAAEKDQEGDRLFRRAAAEYDSFVLEFPRSSAIPYALLRKARCLHHSGRRFQAVRAYQELLDFFPNQVNFAAASIFYMGLAAKQNGDDSDAMRFWKRMADDEEYRKHYLAATAINQLAANYETTGDQTRAISYYRQVAVDFRRSNDTASWSAMWKVVPHYIRTKPDEGALRQFYIDVQSFERRPQRVPEDVQAERSYWNHVRSQVRANGNFNDLQGEQRRRYYAYWAGVMEGRFPDWDAFQIDYISFRRLEEGDAARWMARLDRQFAQFQKDDDYNRVVTWIRAYAGHEGKVQEYFNKLRFDKMTNDAKYQLSLVFMDDIKDRSMALGVLEKLNYDDATDAWLLNPVVNKIRHYRDDALMETVCTRFKDADRGKLELLRYYVDFRSNAAKALPIAEELAKVPEYASEARYRQGMMLQQTNRFEEAIAAYQAADDHSPPAPKFRRAECFVRLGRLAAAISELREIENFFKDHAPEARWRAAGYYKAAGDERQHIVNLRALVRLYPRSAQASNAHTALQELGVLVGGGTDDE